MTEKLLREYVRSSLMFEDDGGYDAMSPYGTSFGSGQDLYNIFIKPFTDVVDTAAGEVSKASVKVQTAAKVAFETVATTFIPFLSSDYDDIWDAEAQQIEKIQAKYKDVYDATWTAIRDNDVMAAAFGYNPASFVTSRAVKAAPLPVLKTLNALTGGRLGGVVDKVSALMKGRDTKKPIDRDSGGQVVAGYSPSGSLVRELSNASVEKLTALATSDQIKQAMGSNQRVRQMQNDVQGVVDGTLTKVYNRAQSVMKAKSPDDLKKLIGKQVPGMDKLAQVPEENREQVTQQVMAAVKQAAKKMYVTGVKLQAQSAVKAGVPENHPYVVAHLKVAQKIQAL